MLVNSKEIVMKELLDRYIDQLHMKCTCPICKNDVLALSLNQVKPSYVTDKKRLRITKPNLLINRKIRRCLLYWLNRLLSCQPAQAIIV